MTVDLLTHNVTRIEIENFILNPAHALIIDGKQGSGKLTIAQHIASQLLGIDSDKLANSPYLLHVLPSHGSSISIDTVRQIQNFLKLKTTGRRPIRRLLIIEQAETMTVEAQNAFLKILEEPPADTVIILLTSQRHKLLPTIRSRARILLLKSLSKIKITDYFLKKGYDADEVNTSYYISDAQIGLMSSLLVNTEDNLQIELINTAKQLLAKSCFERLNEVDRLIKQRTSLDELCYSLAIICRAALHQTIDKSNNNQARRWHKNLAAVLDAQKKLASNANSKLLLTDLFINL